MFRSVVAVSISAFVLASAASGQVRERKEAQGAGKAPATQQTGQQKELPELATDRPDFTEVTETVRPGVVQVEMGITLDREGGVRHLSQGEIVTRIGAGGMGEVFMAHDPRLDRRVAIKLLPERLAGDADADGVGCVASELLPMAEDGVVDEGAVAASGSAL